MLYVPLIADEAESIGYETDVINGFGISLSLSFSLRPRVCFIYGAVVSEENISRKIYISNLSIPVPSFRVLDLFFFKTIEKFNFRQ